MTSRERPIPRATYRLQLSPDFGFAAAAALAPYLSALGVSHVYCSPYLKARSGSLHGYDVVDHNALNPALGSEADFADMSAAFRRNNLGQIIDFVPNHMGVGGADNRLWIDVLEWGPDSMSAEWFDIDWNPEQQHLRNKVLVPFLGDQYGAVLEAGDIVLKFDAEAGSFAVWAYDAQKLPICPLDYGVILGEAGDQATKQLADDFAHLRDSRDQAITRATALKAELAALARSDEGAAAIARAVDGFNGLPGDLERYRRLNELIQRQHWRAAYFRVAADEINYRRFFNVNDLAGVRMEAPQVFDRAHELVFRLLREGTIDGIRLDHVDGLFDPKEYFERLREKAPRPFYLLVEKILGPHESLREDWDVEGTTGYEFTNLIVGLLVDPGGEQKLNAVYQDFAGGENDFEDIVRRCKLRIMDDEMAGELNGLARAAGRVARSDPRTADFTDNHLRRALRQIIASFQVYRTYVDRNGASEADRSEIDRAIASARHGDPMLDQRVYDFLRALLTVELEPGPLSSFSRADVTDVAMRFQQSSGPIMAKGLEDTAFYQYNRLLALNEVGGHPDRFGVSVATFHAANRERLRQMPQTMLSTSTHDTKRGEDGRMRLAVLSEVPEEWGERITSWSRMIRTSEGLTAENSPDGNDEYALYQMLLGAWPNAFCSGVADPEAMATFRLRIEAATIKALRESKRHTTWAAPDAGYEQAMLDFIRSALDVSRENAFLEDFQAFAADVASLGARNSLIQTVLKLTVPGVPDIYQGAEFYDLSLVDPDNRRPVDFEQRQVALKDLDASAFDATDLLENWHDGRLKLAVTSSLLRFRREYPDLFGSGAYQPLDISGPDAHRICAFARESGDVRMIVAVRLFPADDDKVAASVALSETLANQQWFSLPDRQAVQVRDRSFAATGLFPVLPICVLSAVSS